MTAPTGAAPAVARPALWAGVESSYLRVRRQVRDQLAETGHADRAGDLSRLADIGASAVRYPVLWGRAAGGRPTSPTTDWTWATDRLDRLRRLGVEPIVELLHHGFGPLGADPFDAGWPERFGTYAGRVARRFPWVRRWLPINEPLTTARFAGLYGWWWPHGCGREAFVRLLLAQALGWRAAARAPIRAEIPGAQLFVNEDAGEIDGPPEVARAVTHDSHRRWLTFDLLTGRVRPGHALWSYLASVPGAGPALASLAGDPVVPDGLGLDYYITSDRWLDHRLDAFPPDSHGRGHGLRYADIETVRVAGTDIQGWDRVIASAWERYLLPLALTEVQLAGEMADQVAWWREAWEAAVEATDRGIPVVGVTAWSVFGSWDWDSVLLRHGRSFEPGCLSPAPRFSRPHPLETALRRTVRDGRPGPSPDGWWRRPDRVRYHPRVLWRPDRAGPAAVADLLADRVAAAP